MVRTFDQDSLGQGSQTQLNWGPLEVESGSGLSTPQKKKKKK